MRTSLKEILADMVSESYSNAESWALEGGYFSSFNADKEQILETTKAEMLELVREIRAAEDDL